MPLSFVIGRAGSGKTHRCLDGMAREARDNLRESPTDSPRHLLLIVPEQATFQMEKALFGGENLTPGAQVLSFRRLAWRVFGEAGGPPSKPVDDIGKRMVLRAIASQHRENLSLFSRIALRPGFIDSLASCLKELTSYEVSAEQLSQLSRNAALPAFLTKKLADLTFIMSQYDKRLEGAFTDPDRLLSLLASKIPCSAMCRGAHIWIDGFSGFTPQEMKVIMALCKAAASVSVSLTIDPDPVLLNQQSAEALFAPTIRTYNQLKKFANESGVEVSHTLVVTPPRTLPRYDSPELSHLESEFGKTAVSRWESETEHITLSLVPTRTAEVEHVAHAILRLAQDSGFRWNDMAILVHDLDSYRGSFESAFSKLSIPFFIDARKPVTYHPLVEAVRALIEIFTEGVPTDAVLRLLKTDLLNCTRDEADRLENYVLARGIQGKMWLSYENWNPPAHAGPGCGFDPGGIVRAALGKVLSLAEQPAGQKSIVALISAVEESLGYMNVTNTLEDWARAEERSGRIEEVSLHQQIYDGVTSVLAQAREMLGSFEMEPDEARLVLETGLSSLSLGMVPPSLDQVIIGSLDRSRHPKVRAVFIMGLVEGSFPGRPVEDLLFSDAERETLQKMGMEMAPTATTKTLEQDFAAYVAFTRSSERLFLSRPLMDDSGRPLAESPVLPRLRTIFSNLCEISVTGQQADSSIGDTVSSLLHERSACALIASIESRSADATPEQITLKSSLQRWFEKHMPRHIEFLSAARRENTESALPPDLAGLIFGASLEMSVSRLESFALCPFQHFARYGLRLEERKIGRVTPQIAGTFMHDAMSRFIKGTRGLESGLSDVPDEKVLEFADVASSEAMYELAQEFSLESPRTMAELQELRHVIRGAALVLAEHQRRGQFRPVDAEVEFGRDGQIPVPEMVTDSGARLQLRGRIDLVEKARSGGLDYFRVIDLKTRSKDISLSDIWNGVDLQLVGYAYIALSYGQKIIGDSPLPAGMLYFPLREKYSRLDSIPCEEETERERLERRRMSGLLRLDKNALALMDTSQAKKSALVPVSYNNNGDPRPTRSVLTPAAMECLADRFVELARRNADFIALGDVRISPYRSGQQSACARCDYSALCAFDTTRKENRYRYPEPVLITKILAQAGEGDHNQ